jgi:site-specific recombinase XerD
MADLFFPTTTTETLLTVNESGLPTTADQIREACHAWLLRSPSVDTRSNYERDVRQFVAFTSIPADDPIRITRVRPAQVAAWRDHLLGMGLTNASVRRKMTALRSFFSYLQTYGYVGANPAHSDFVAAPAVARDGKTVALSVPDCRRLLDAPPAVSSKRDSTQEIARPAGIRDQAIFAILAFTGCRVGELTRLKVGSYKQTSVYKVLEVHGKGGKERLVPINIEAAERLEAWLDVADIRDDPAGPLFRPTNTARGGGHDGFARRPMTRRAVQKLVDR